MRGIPNAFFEKVLFLFYRIDGQIKQYFRGLMAMTFLDMITLAVGLWLLGFLHPGLFPPGKSLLLGLVCAVLSWVPFVGSIVGCVLVVVVCAVEAPGDGVILASAMALFAVVRLLDDFVYTPATIGRSLSVHPLLTVLMIFAGGVIAGVPGLLLALPVLGICMVLGDVFGQVWFDQRLRARHRYRKKLEQMQAQEDLV
jgi:predicted PurR-regulated permease PerM